MPLPGSGFWADERASVAATGVGEAITAALLSYRVHDRFIRSSSDLHASMQWGISELIETGVSVGLIGLGSEGEAAGFSNTDMPWAAWLG